MRVVTKAFLPLLGADRALHGKPGRIVSALEATSIAGLAADLVSVAPAPRRGS